MINYINVTKENVIRIMVEHQQECSFCNGTIRKNGEYIDCDDYQMLMELEDLFFPEPLE